MALTKEQIKSLYPLPVYNYKVDIDSDTVAFSEVSGLSVSYEVSTYKESQVESGIAGPRTMLMPGQRAPVKVTLRKGVVVGKSLSTFFEWWNSTQLHLVDKKDIFVRLCDENGDPVITWKVINAFPTKLDAPTFDAKSNDVAIESMELTADSVTIEEA
jgi:phage tail-like protein